MPLSMGLGLISLSDLETRCDASLLPTILCLNQTPQIATLLSSTAAKVELERVHAQQCNQLYELYRMHPDLVYQLWDEYGAVWRCIIWGQ